MDLREFLATFAIFVLLMLIFVVPPARGAAFGLLLALIAVDVAKLVRASWRRGERRALLRPVLRHLVIAAILTAFVAGERSADLGITLVLFTVLPLALVAFALAVYRAVAQKN